MAYHGENDPDIPYDGIARKARNTEANWQPVALLLDEPRERDRTTRDWAPKLPKSNYPRELIDLATEEDREMRYDIAVRNRVREHLAQAGLADSHVGISDWEQYWREKQKARAKEWRQMVSRTNQRKRNQDRDRN